MMLGGGCGQELAHWVVYGRPEKDMYSYDIRQVDGPTWAGWRPVLQGRGLRSPGASWKRQQREGEKPGAGSAQRGAWAWDPPPLRVGFQDLLPGQPRR